MTHNFRFAIISDLHIALPHTIWRHPSRFHWVEVSIPALEVVLQELAQLDLDFLLVPGDLTQHGEPENHAWLSNRLAQFPCPVYVIPGNHDVIERSPTDQSIGLADFPIYYRKFGYADVDTPYYSREILPGVQLIGLNSNGFDVEGKQLYAGLLDATQFLWLQQTLIPLRDHLVMVMVHHNVIEHLPDQSGNALGRRYMIESSAALLRLLQAAGVRLLFTGHLHIQDVAQSQSVYEITTGSLVSYPHPYRVLRFEQDDQGNQQLKIESRRVMAIPEQPNLQHLSREWLGDRSLPLMLQLLTQPPLNLPDALAKELVPSLRYFWADIASGDATFNFPQFPPLVEQYFKNWSRSMPTVSPTLSTTD
ncbi:MAG: metallophosphoesterase [Leptolyngbyaceae cyanobacterium CRU_2_3]|nr:metallophosphoesterase [Leptolyngbyaceae cyanobacterium CRU_2_3]